MKLKRNKISGLTSRMVANATLSMPQVLKLGRAIDPRRTYTVPVYASTYKGKSMLVGLCGGQQGDQEGTIDFTLLGSSTMEVLQSFPDFNDSLIVYFIKCTGKPDRVIQRVTALFDEAPDMGSVAIIGDFSGECDGKILSLIGIGGESVLLRRDEQGD